MELWPAIDIRGGRCVRLLRGNYSAETIYGDPLEQAERFVAAGASRLHVVDLDAARGGSSNTKIVLRIASATGVPVQAGGGVRDERAAGALLEGGVERVVAGTVAVEHPDVLAMIAERWPGRVLAGLDHRPRGEATGGPKAASSREVAVRGWVKGGGVSLDEALARLAELPLAGVVVTDIDRDGTGAGPDLEGLAHALEISELPVIASGGVSGAADLGALAGLEVAGRRLKGAIVGKALVSGVLTVADAEAACGS